MKKIFLIFLFVSLFSSLVLEVRGEEKLVWDYQQPEKWGALQPSYTLCRVGKNQSPININHGIKFDKNLLTVHCSEAPLYLRKDGLIELTIGTQTFMLNMGHTIALEYPTKNETIKYAGELYNIVEIHFHAPAEHSLNGKLYPAEVHIVTQGEHGKVVVIAVFIQEGDHNPHLQNVLNNVPKEKGKLVQVPNVSLNPNIFLPGNRSYYNYLGSLTTPPCVESIQWVVMNHPIAASRTQIDQLRAAIGIKNNRPLQPLNNRQILYVPISLLKSRQFKAI